MRILSTKGVLAIAASILPCLTVVSYAQQQINTQVNNDNPKQNPYNPATLHYVQQFDVMPSERLMAFQRSGMMPSEYLLNLQSAGPLAPQGAVDYIQPQSQLQQELRLPPPVLFNPAYVTPLPANANAPEPPPPLPSSDSFYLKRADVAPSPYQINQGGPIDRNISGNVAPPPPQEESTVTYYLPKKTNRSSSIAPAQHQNAAESPATQPAASATKK